MKNGLKKKENNYDENSIRGFQTAQETVRERTTSFITDPNGEATPIHLFQELFSNAVDEIRNCDGIGDKIEVELSDDYKYISVKDYGRGIPFGYKEDKGMSAYKYMITSLFSGGKLKTEGSTSSYKSSAGTNGLGLLLINSLSNTMTLEAVRKNFEKGVYEKGELTTIDGNAASSTGDVIVSPANSAKSYTKIGFEPSSKYINEIVYYDPHHIGDLIHNTAYTTPSITYSFTHKGKTTIYQEKEGIKKLFNKAAKSPLYKEFYITKDILFKTVPDSVRSTFNIKDFDEEDLEDFEIYFNHSNNFHEAEDIHFMNTLRCIEGGSATTAFKRAFLSTINESARKIKLMSEKEADFTVKDLDLGSVIACSIFFSGTPGFNGNLKTKYTKEPLRQYLLKALSVYFDAIIHTIPGLLESIVKKLKQNRKFEADKGKLEAAASLKIDKNASRPTALMGKLIDASMGKLSDRQKQCSLYLLEGGSAATPLTRQRNPLTDAIMGLRGKVPNVLDQTPLQVMDNSEYANIVHSMGCGLGDKFNMNLLRYNSIILVPDPDDDGYHILTLLIVFFMKFMPKLVTEGKIKILYSPLYKTEYKGETEYHYTKDDFLKFTEKYPKADSTRFKGFGEVDSGEDIQRIIFSKERKLITLTNDDFMGNYETLKQLMGKDTATKKDLMLFPENFKLDLESIIGKHIKNKTSADMRISVATVVTSGMYKYGKAVNEERAIPNIVDGLKPVHRLLLYAMSEMGCTSKPKKMKSARVVGDTIGKYSPHGDAATYGALVNLGRDFNLNMPPVTPAGEFGTATGGGESAMRYTECYVSPYGNQFLKYLDQIDTAPNYDNKLTVPVQLLPNLPNLLVNGGEGIAYGFSTGIPPHNPKDIADRVKMFLSNRLVSVDILAKDLYPDFPTGGILDVHNAKQMAEIQKIYKYGKGGATLHGNYEVVACPGHEDKKVIRITNLPYQVKAMSFGDSNVTSVEDKIKQGMDLGHIVLESYVNSSTEKPDINLIVNNNLVNKTINYLQEKCNLIEKYKYQMYTISPVLLKVENVDGSIDFKMERFKFECVNLLDVIREFVEYKEKIIFKKFHDAGRKNRRRHEQLNGVLIVLPRIKELMDIVIKNTDAKLNAIVKKTFNLTDIQTEFVLAKSTRSWSTTGKEEIAEEMKKLDGEYAYIEKITKSDTNNPDIDAIIISDMNESLTKENSARRTVINTKENLNIQADIDSTKVQIQLHKNGLIHVESLANTKVTGRGAKGTNINNDIKDAIDTYSDKKVLFLTDNKCYNIKVIDLINAGATSLLNIIAEGDKYVGMFDYCSSDDKVLIVTKKGRTKVMNIKVLPVTKSGKSIFKNLDADDQIVSVKSFDSDNDNLSVLISTQHKAVRFKIEALSDASASSTGVLGINLDPKDHVVDAAVVSDTDTIAVIDETGFVRVMKASVVSMSNRNTKGSKFSTGKELIASMKVIDPTEDHVATIVTLYKTVTFPLPESESGRTSKGYKAIDLAAGDKVISIK